MTTRTKTQAEIEAYEQKITAAQASVKEIREGVYSVPSSREGVYPQIITTDENGVANYCTCEGSTYHGHCYHREAVTRFVAAQKAVEVAEEIIAEAQEVEYLRMKDGALVRKDAQARNRERGEFSLLK